MPSETRGHHQLRGHNRNISWSPTAPNYHHILARVDSEVMNASHQLLRTPALKTHSLSQRSIFFFSSSHSRMLNDLQRRHPMMQDAGHKWQKGVIVDMLRLYVLPHLTSHYIRSHSDHKWSTWITGTIKWSSISKLLKCEWFLVSFLFYDSKLNIFGLWTKQDICGRCHPFLTLLKPTQLIDTSRK